MKNAIKTLLQMDLEYAAKSIGLPISSTGKYDESTLYDIINEIELALLEGKDAASISSVCALLWTHFGKSYDLLAGYIYSVMTRIGFSPIQPMLATKDGRVNYTSLAAMLETTVQRYRYSIGIFDKRFFLTEFQSRLWDALSEHTHIAVSAPTSAGKSFLLCLNLIYNTAKRHGVSIYIVPNLTLMSQVANDLIDLARKFAPEIDIKTHLPGETATRPTIYVLTQERLIEPGANFVDAKINFLIIDEVQNIERAFDFQSTDERSRLLLDVLVNLHDTYNPRKTVIIGPRISEAASLAGKLFSKRAIAVTANSSPVTNICYAITPVKKDAEEVMFTQYSELSKKSLSLKVQNTIGASGFKKQIYDDDFKKYLTKVTQGHNGSLIFSPTATQSRRTAVALGSRLNETTDKTLASLAEYIRRTVSPNYDLAYCVQRGVTFHHGKMPQHVRNAIEFAIAERQFAYVTCTTTLMQGVNIPAKTVFLRNPHLFLKRNQSSVELSAYEIANLRGRAGRLMTDFVGRTFVLDGTSFDIKRQESLFEAPTKKLDGSYKEMFDSHRKEVVDSISEANQERGALARYVANVVYTDNAAGVTLSRKGIVLSDQEFLAVKRSVMRLTVPVEVCRQHRYWDPFDLQKLYEYRNTFALPSSPFEDDCAKSLELVIRGLCRLLPKRAEYFLGKTNMADPMPWIISVNAVNWAKEQPLKELLETDFARENNDNTERAISLLQNTISFGLPSLLSPIYTILGKSSILLPSIERGAVRRETLLQLEHNIPRETAIAVTNRAKKQKYSLQSIASVLEYLKATKVSYWSAVQFRHLIEMDLITK